MTLTTAIIALVNAVAQNLPTLVALGAALVSLLTQKNAADQSAAKAKAFDLAIQVVKDLTTQNLGTKEKRDAAVSFVLTNLPDNMKKHVNEQLATLLVEQAWGHMVKPVLDQPKN